MFSGAALGLPLGSDFFYLFVYIWYSKGLFAWLFNIYIALSGCIPNASVHCTFSMGMLGSEQSIPCPSIPTSWLSISLNLLRFFVEWELFCSVLDSSSLAAASLHLGWFEQLLPWHSCSIHEVIVKFKLRVGSSSWEPKECSSSWLATGQVIKLETKPAFAIKAAIVQAASFRKISFVCSPDLSWIPVLNIKI